MKIFKPVFSYDEEHNFLASVSDLMSGLIFFFIIALIIFSFRLESATQKKELEDEIMRKTRDQILEDVRDRAMSLGLEIFIDKNMGVLRLFEEGVLFPLGKADLTEFVYRENVGKLAYALSEVIPCYTTNLDETGIGTEENNNWCPGLIPTRTNYKCDSEKYPAKIEAMFIEGHTDAVPLIKGSKFRDNFELSSARAALVLNMFKQCRQELDLLQNKDRIKIMSVSGYAFLRPLIPENLYDGRNRRIELRFIMERLKVNTPKGNSGIKAITPEEEPLFPEDELEEEDADLPPEKPVEPPSTSAPAATTTESTTVAEQNSELPPEVEVETDVLTEPEPEQEPEVEQEEKPAEEPEEEPEEEQEPKPEQEPEAEPEPESEVQSSEIE